MRFRNIQTFLVVAAALTLFSVRAERTANSFFTIEGEGVRIASDGSIRVDAGASGPVKLTARSGWLVNGRESVTYRSARGLSSGLILTSKLGEDHSCSPPPPTEEDKHDTTFVLEADATPSNLIAMYALPSTSVVVTASAESSLVEKGKHKVTTTWQEWTCPVCGAHQEGRTEVSYYDVEPDTYEWTAVAAGDTQDSNTWSGPMPKGLDQEIKFTVTGKWNPCQEGKCEATATDTATADVHELSVERPDYLGLDWTDAGLSGRAVADATAHIDPAPASATYNWTKCGKCQFDGKTDEQEVTYGITNSSTASTSFLAEELTVTATAENAEGEEASATCTTNFTIVAVDVQIGSVGEAKEEKEGAFLSYVPDTNGVISVEGTNKMVEVKFTCNPSLPENEMVTISHTGPGELYEVLASGEYSLVASGNYRAYDVSNRTFKLHGHAASTSLTNGAITIEHANSGAKDLAKYTNLGRPLLVPDYDRNGSIDEDDIAKAKAGDSVFRFWINDDNDSGDVNDSKNDRPGSGTNGSDAKVNGRGDLLDFTPVLIDVSSVFPSDATDELKARCSLQLKSSAANVVWTSLAPSEAGSFHREDKGTKFGPDLSQNAHEATVTSLADWSELPVKFGELLPDFGDKGVILVEGRVAGSSLRIKVCLDDGQSIAEGELNIRVSAVEDMYRWMCLRNVCGDSSGLGSRLSVPANRPDAECDGRHFVFVHGYNVDVQSARGWASEMFKRLWQAGSQSMFTAVDWFGNDSQIPSIVPMIGGESLDYYVNVRHALDSSLNLSVAANASLLGNKIFLAHSLGNVLVSAAAKDHALNYSKYYMLNAAVPIEAYDNAAIAEEMTEHGWRDVPSTKWAANWYARIPYEGDPRSELRWRGRFSGLHGVINCYSPTEDILANASVNAWNGLWSMQELFKGTASLHFIPGNCEGGWGYNGMYTDAVGLLKTFAKTNVFTDAQLIVSPIFRKFDNALLHQPNVISITQTELNKVMGDGIPATSFAAGRNAISGGGVDENIDYSQTIPSAWPSSRIDGGVRLWHHSDIGRVAYFYVHRIFKKITLGVNQ